MHDNFIFTLLSKLTFVHYLLLLIIFFLFGANMYFLYRQYLG